LIQLRRPCGDKLLECNYALLKKQKPFSLIKYFADLSHLIAYLYLCST